MAFAAREILESQHLSEVRGQFKGERRFEVLGDPDNPLDASTARSASGIPTIGNSFSASFPNLTCIALDFRHRPGTNIYQVDARYESDPLYLPPIVTASLSMERAWRAAGTPTLPVDPYVDIGGTPIDSDGVPAEAPIWQTKIVLPKLYFADTIDDLPWLTW